MTPVKHIGLLKGGAGFPHSEQGVDSQELEFYKVKALGMANSNSFLSQGDDTVSASTAGRLGAFIFPNRSIVFAKVGAALLLSRFCLLHRRACLDNNMMGLVVNGDNWPEYIRYSLGLLPMGFLVNPGAVPSVNERNMGELSLPTPTLKEQTQIAAFLDHETAKIDALIEKQQQLIALLAEKRQAVISHAVTKGLNPDAPMRDSGVEWLGEVPEGWEVKQVRHLSTQLGGGTPSKDNQSFWGGDVPWVTPKDMKVDYLNTAHDFITETAVRQSSAKYIPVGSVLIVVRGMILDHSVPTALTKKQLTVNQDMKAIVPRDNLSGEFLLFVLKGIRDYLLSHTYSSAHGTKVMSVDKLDRTFIVLPQLEEQLVLVAQLKARLGKIDDLIMKARSTMELLQERRSALISAAVTGKIDVRGWVAPSSEVGVEAEEEVG